MLILRPISALSSVDFPTLGRPTIAAYPQRCAEPASASGSGLALGAFFGRALAPALFALALAFGLARGLDIGFELHSLEHFRQRFRGGVLFRSPAAVAAPVGHDVECLDLAPDH